MSEIWKLRHTLFAMVVRILDQKTLVNMAGLLLAGIAKRKISRGTPYFLMVEPTSRCNLRCPMCMLSIFGLKNRAVRDMSFGEFKGILDKVKTPPLVILFWNYGEPLLNPDLCKMVNYAREKRIASIVYSNGTLLNKEKTREILESGLDYLSISIDGAKRGTYEKYRSGGDFDALMENVKFLLEERKRLGRTRPFVEIQCIIMRDNEAEMNGFLDMGCSLGVDKVIFRKLAYQPESAGFNPKNFLPARDAHIRSFYRKGVKCRKNCMRPWSEAVINSDGSVVPCCYDFFSLEKMGNVFSSSLDEIWSGERYNGFRGRLCEAHAGIMLCDEWCSENGYDHNKFICA